MVHTTSSSSSDTNNKNNKKTTPLLSSQFKSSLEKAKKQSDQLLNAIVVHYEQELSRLGKFEQELIEKDALMEELALVEREEMKKAFEKKREHFALIINYLRGISITEKIQQMNDEDLNGFIEEVVFYGVTPIYDLLPSRGRKILSSKSGMEGWFVKFDPDYCSSQITLESETRARCNGDGSCWVSVLGTKSNSFKVRLISNSAWLMIGFAPKSIDVNKSENFRCCGYYLFCKEGKLYSQNGDEDKSYIDSRIIDGSIVECLLDKENGTISYKVDGKSYGVAFSNIPVAANNSDGVNELYPAFDIGSQTTFELVNEQ